MDTTETRVSKFSKLTGIQVTVESRNLNSN